MTPFSAFPRVHLCHLPTPVERLIRLASSIGLSSLLIKRDDCTALGGGGNKGRKLEFLLGAAVNAQVSAIVTGGGVQSNHARQTAGAAARLGIACHLVLTAAPPARGRSYAESGNRLLDDLFGANVSIIGPDADLNTAIVAKAERLSAQGLRVCTLPVGGSNACGALGYVAAGFEIADDLRRLETTVSRIVIPTASGGTQAGLLLGLALAGLDIPLEGVSVGAPKDRQIKRVADCLVELETLLDCRGRIPPEAIRVQDSYVGAAYGEPTAAMVRAVRLAGETEGLLLDPVYTGKAMAGLVDLTQRGIIGGTENVLFLHTGGTPALFVYDNLFSTPQKGQVFAER